MTGRFTHEPTGLTVDTIFDLEPAHNTWNPQERTGSRHNVEVWLGIRGGQGAVMLSISSGWFHSTDDSRNPKSLFSKLLKPGGVAISYHFYRQIAKYMTPSSEPCDWLEGEHNCYGDISYLASNEAFDALTDQGLTGLYNYLVEAYHAILQQETPT